MNSSDSKFRITFYPFLVIFFCNYLKMRRLGEVNLCAGVHVYVFIIADIMMIIMFSFSIM
jgi:hypothetical protein